MTHSVTHAGGASVTRKLIQGQSLFPPHGGGPGLLTLRLSPALSDGSLNWEILSCWYKSMMDRGSSRLLLLRVS